MNDSTEMQEKSRPAPSVPDRGADSGALQTITRLLVGGALMGADVLQNQLETWDQENQERVSSSSTDREGLTAKNGIRSAAAGQPEEPESLPNRTQYALLGLLFQSQASLQKATKTLDRAERATWKLTTPVHKPLGTWRIFAPARKRYEHLAARGSAEVDRWVQLGRVEAKKSRELTGTALENTVDESVDFVVTSPQVREVIKETSTSLGSEIGDGMRSRTVSSDTLVEGLVRRLFRRPPREYPSEPPISREMLKQGGS